MHDIVTIHNSKKLKTFLEYNKVPDLKWPGNSPKKEFHRERFDYNEERGW